MNFFDSLVMEVRLQIHKMTKDIISENEIDKNIQYFKKGESAKMHKKFHYISIRISYDMRWGGKNAPPDVYIIHYLVMGF